MTRADSLAAVVIARVRQLQAGDSESDDACSTESPPLSEKQLRAIEERLGYALPSSLKELYTSIANGGFGPAYGLLGFDGGMKQEDGHDALAQYEFYRRPDSDDSYWHWPEGLVPLVDLGCAMFFCVDCSTSDGAMIWFEPNAHVQGESWEPTFVPLRMTFEELMRAWGNGTNVLSIMEAAWNAR